MNLREEFKKETGLSTIIDNDYIEWLEDRVKRLPVDKVIFPSSRSSSNEESEAFTNALSKKSIKIPTLPGRL
jgi:hypothetical protein